MTAVEAGDTDAYALVYAEQHPRLVAYARTLTGNSWQAEDLVAEAHFRVWRRLSAGHRVDNAPAYLAATVRNLAATVGPAAAREIPDGDLAAVAAVGQQQRGADDPAQRVASVHLLSAVLKQLPERWVQALWLSEAEDQPLEAVGRQLGTNPNATAVLLNRAREGLRQAFLRAQPGAPADPACADFWNRLPAHVRDADSPRYATAVRAHTEECADCHTRMLVLMQANNRLPALVGPALLIASAGGALRFLVPAAAGAGAGAGAGAVTSAKATGVGAGAAAGGGTAGAAGTAGIAVIGAAIAVAAMMAGGSPAKTDAKTHVRPAAAGRPSLAAKAMPSATATDGAASPATVAATSPATPPPATRTPTPTRSEFASLAAATTALPTLTAVSVPPVIAATAALPSVSTTALVPSPDPTVAPARTPTPASTPAQTPQPRPTATATAEPEPTPEPSVPPTPTPTPTPPPTQPPSTTPPPTPPAPRPPCFIPAPRKG